MPVAYEVFPCDVYNIIYYLFCNELPSEEADNREGIVTITKKKAATKNSENTL